MWACVCERVWVHERVWACVWTRRRSSKGGEGITTLSSSRPRQSADWAKGKRGVGVWGQCSFSVCVYAEQTLDVLKTIVYKKNLFIGTFNKGGFLHKNDLLLKLFYFENWQIVLFGKKKTQNNFWKFQAFDSNIKKPNSSKGRIFKKVEVPCCRPTVLKSPFLHLHESEASTKQQVWWQTDRLIIVSVCRLF